MKDMKCYDCVLKHLAAALSYAKEIRAGHDKNAELDHRPDLLGELVNAEHHLELLDPALCQTAAELRKKLQAESTFPGLDDLEQLRSLWRKTEEQSGVSGSSVSSSKKVTTTCGSCGKQRSLLGPISSIAATACDIVIPLWTGGSKYDELELRFALRSIEKYLHGYQNIIVVADKVPAWIQNVKIIDSVLDSSRKNVNMFRKMAAAAEQSDAVSIVSWCDDFVQLKHLPASNLPAFTNGKNLLEYTNDSVWHQCLNATGEVLKKHGKTTFNCESHTPAIFDRAKFLELAELTKAERETEPGICYVSLYQNFYESKLLDMDKYKFTAESNIGGADKAAASCAGKLFLGYDDTGFESGVREFLEKTFQKPSRYELRAMEGEVVNT